MNTFFVNYFDSLDHVMTVVPFTERIHTKSIHIYVFFFFILSIKGLNGVCGCGICSDSVI